YRGGEGPVSVTTPRAGNNPLFHAMVEAGVQAGYPRTDDLNGYQQEGFGPMDRTVTPEGRRRHGSRWGRCPGFPPCGSTAGSR
ncbi:GMC family oxidoreductase N-terminal domain-containing protein, partial [Pseudomonas aeruginosa]